MSGTEEVPNTRPTNRPIYWKEMTWIEKAWYWIVQYIPILIWIGFGFIIFKCGSD